MGSAAKLCDTLADGSPVLFVGKRAIRRSAMSTPANMKKPNVADEFAKRAFDIGCSVLGLVLSAPIMLAIAALIKLDSEGPVFYRGARVGKDGRPFKMLKFRSMVVGADRMGGPSTPDEDPRLTKVGQAIRRYKLDELPQLVNVLRGEMSIVGPRPEVPEYVALLTEDEKQVLSVRPGMTDWASIWNSDEGAALAGTEDPEKVYLEQIRPEKIRLQLEYVRRRSLWVDLQIIASTWMKLMTPRSRRRKPRAGRPYG